MVAYWSMPCRTPAQRAARAEAKRQYEAAHPMPGTDAIASWPVDTEAERQVAILAQRAHLPPDPRIKTEERDGAIVFVGASGNVYRAVLENKFLLRASYRAACYCEGRQNRRADDKQPGTEVR